MTERKISLQAMEPVPFFLFFPFPDDVESLDPPVRLKDSAMYFPERGTARPDMTSCFRCWLPFKRSSLSVLDACSGDKASGKGMRSSIRLSSPPSETSFPSNWGGWVGANGFFFFAVSFFSFSSQSLSSLFSSFFSPLLCAFPPSTALAAVALFGGGGTFNETRPGNTIKNLVGPPLFVAFSSPDAIEGNVMDIACTARLRKKTSEPLHDCCSKFPGVRWLAGEMAVDLNAGLSFPESRSRSMMSLEFFAAEPFLASCGAG